MAPFIDIHCHILPGVDDGPKTMEDSLELARALCSKGCIRAVATPHYIEDYTPAYRQKVEQAFGQLTEALQAEKIPLPLNLGGELLITPVLAALARAGTLPTLHGTRYVLLELPLYQPLPLYTENIFFTLQAQGYIPILAHPERMEAFKGNIRTVYELAGRGILMQVNLGSLVGVHGRSAKRLALDILKYRLASFVASDSHDAALLDMVGEALKRPTFPPDLLLENPQKALNGEKLALDPQKPARSIQDKRKGILKF